MKDSRHMKAFFSCEKAFYCSSVKVVGNLAQQFLLPDGFSVMFHSQEPETARLNPELEIIFGEREIEGVRPVTKVASWKETAVAATARPCDMPCNHSAAEVLLHPLLFMLPLRTLYTSLAEYCACSWMTGNLSVTRLNEIKVEIYQHCRLRGGTSQWTEEGLQDKVESCSEKSPTST